MDIKNMSRETKLGLIKEAAKACLDELDPNLIGNEHIVKCFYCDGVPNHMGNVLHTSLCAIKVLQLFVKDPSAYLESGGHTEAGLHFLNPRRN